MKLKNAQEQRGKAQSLNKEKRRAQKEHASLLSQLSKPPYSAPSSNFGSMMTVLPRIYAGYKKFLNLRRSVCEACCSRTKIFCGVSEWYETNLEDATAAIKTDICVMSNFVNEYFPGFQLLPKAEKMLLFGTFFKNVIVIERAFWTSKQFPQNDDDRLAICFNQFLHSDHRSNLSTTATCKDGHLDIAGIFKPVFGKICKAVKRCMMEIEASEIEMVALLCISLWDDGLETLSESTKVFAREVRNLLFRELYSICAVVDKQGAPMRFGNLLHLLELAEEASPALTKIAFYCTTESEAVDAGLTTGISNEAK